MHLQSYPLPTRSWLPPEFERRLPAQEAHLRPFHEGLHLSGGSAPRCPIPPGVGRCHQVAPIGRRRAASPPQLRSRQQTSDTGRRRQRITRALPLVGDLRRPFEHSAQLWSASNPRVAGSNPAGGATCGKSRPKPYELSRCPPSRRGRPVRCLADRLIRRSRPGIAPSSSRMGTRTRTELGLLRARR